MNGRLPDYTRARREAGFQCSAGGTQSALMELAGIPIRDFNLNPDACIEAFRLGRPRFREIFGDEASLPGPATPAVSYGHINGLGSELIFPEGGEVAHTPIYGSLQQGIKELQRPTDYASAGMIPFYMDFYRQLQKAFPGENVGWGFKHEGPLTTAWTLRGHDFFTDLYDNPEQTERFLGLVTKSIIDYHLFVCRTFNYPVKPPVGGMADDLAAMISPHLWERFVLPFWKKYRQGFTSAAFHVHVEDLRPEHLPLLEKACLDFYDPSVSPRLSPASIAAGCRIPFAWRLCGIDVPQMDERDIENFVYTAVVAGASRVFTYISDLLCREPNIGKIKVFIGTARKVEKMLQNGADRAAVGRLAG